nr:tRNA lysidine(34) synthetase TilS [Secundilactobacillus collinoides]
MQTIPRPVWRLLLEHSGTPFFKRVMLTHQATVLVTAHHGDDQVETILMKLIRGGDLHQLSGIQRSQSFGNGQLVRPLLDYGKAELKLFAQSRRLTWYEDATNQNDDVLRNRMRHQVVPLLKRENPRLLAHVQHYADELNTRMMLSDEVISKYVDRLTVSTMPPIGDVRGFKLVPKPLQSPVIQAFLTRAGAEPATHVADIVQLLTGSRPQGEVALGNHFLLLKTYTYFSVTNDAKLAEKPRVQMKNVVVSNQWVHVTKWLTIRLIATDRPATTDNDRMSVTLTSAELPLIVRDAQPSDRIQLKQGGHKSVRRLLIDHKIPNAKRNRQLVVVTAMGEVLWLVGIQRSFREPRSSGQTFEIQLRLPN